MCERYGSRISGARILLALQTSTNLYKPNTTDSLHKLQLAQTTGYTSSLLQQNGQATCLRMSLAVVLCAYKMSTLMMSVSVLVFKAACQELQMCSSEIMKAEARS